MEKNELERIKKEIDLREFARQKYDILSNERGMANCPFHPGDRIPRLQFWIGRNGYHRFTDHHESGGKGTIVDFVMAMEKCNFQAALKAIEDQLAWGEIEEQDRVNLSG